MRNWSSWCRLRGHHPWLFGLTLDSQVSILSDFILHGHLHGFGSGFGIRSDTLRGYLQGVQHFFRASNLPFPSTHPQIRLLLQGLARADSPRHHKHPVSLELLGTCLGLLDFTKPRDRALWGVVCLSFFFLLRRSEITSLARHEFQWFALKAKDLIVVDNQGLPTRNEQAASGVNLTLSGSKANQRGPASTRYLQRSGDPFICPVQAALFLLKARVPATDELPAALLAPGSSISSADVAKLIKTGAAKLGYDSKAFGTHSLRAGGATLMYRSGIPAITVQFHGRWKSDAFKIYTSLCKESVATMANKMIQGGVRDSTLDPM